MKICPVCGQQQAIDALACPVCSHKFRTVFMPERTMALGAIPVDSYAPPVALRRRGMPKWFAWCLGIFLSLLAIGMVSSAVESVTARNRPIVKEFSDVRVGEPIEGVVARHGRPDDINSWRQERSYCAQLFYGDSNGGKLSVLAIDGLVDSVTYYGASGSITRIVQ